jgi:hypothetical protein
MLDRGLTRPRQPTTGHGDRLATVSPARSRQSLFGEEEEVRVGVGVGVGQVAAQLLSFFQNKRRTGCGRIAVIQMSNIFEAVARQDQCTVFVADNALVRQQFEGADVADRAAVIIAIDGTRRAALVHVIDGWRGGDGVVAGINCRTR